jgi:hypothetical protein
MKKGEYMTCVFCFRNVSGRGFSVVKKWCIIHNVVHFGVCHIFEKTSKKDFYRFTTHILLDGCSEIKDITQEYIPPQNS